MQPSVAPAKPKYRIKDFAAQSNSAINKGIYIPNDSSCKLFCVCNQFCLAKSRKCKRCNQAYHYCVTLKS